MGLPLSIRRALRFYIPRDLYLRPQKDQQQQKQIQVNRSWPQLKKAPLIHFCSILLILISAWCVRIVLIHAFFEETGETYRRVVAACLRPLEHFTQKLAEGLECSSADKSMQLSDQLTSPTERLAVLKLNVSFFDAQNEMLSCGKAGLLEKEWIISSKPLYGTQELLLHKLRLFLDHQAN
ncbi:uncharacterized protein LOC125205370 isoform X2 [Salvia hispanica]|uniref:uncharacterized protein LOC125205370 isoform X2 n=1 Tax=Salvia hispanica TaxID=49212 RepID=UPI0020091B9F|nr:uncharacterized protein LOC125205370 isoform X2 [Salvia hispanica]